MCFQVRAVGLSPGKIYSDTGEISAINRQAGERPVKVSRDTLDILERAVYVSEMTQGAFDVTVGPPVKLWDLKNEIIPDQKSIDEVLQRVGYKNIVIDKTASTVFLKKKGCQWQNNWVLTSYLSIAGEKSVCRRG